MYQNAQNIHFDAILTSLQAQNTKAALKAISEETQYHTGIPASELLRDFEENSAETTAGIGDGIALLYIRSKKITGPFTLLAKLQRPILLSTIDSKPVDVMCLQILPMNESNDYLRTLSRLTRMIKNPKFLNAVRETEDFQTLQMLLNHPEGWMIAA